MSQYAKAFTALGLGVVQAAALLPSDAPPWLLAGGVVVQTAAVFLVPNRPAVTGKR